MNGACAIPAKPARPGLCQPAPPMPGCNAMYGGVLVFILLLLALNWRVAFWVGAGLITALCGTLVIMSVLGITLNMLTMFGLILVLGLLVDDAIVVAENIKAKHEQGVSAMDAAVEGTNQVLWPVFATVLTSIVAFLPLTYIKGNIGDMLGALPIVIASDVREEPESMPSVGVAIH